MGLLSAEPGEEKAAPGTHDNNFHKEQLCKVCQGGKEARLAVAQRTATWLGDIKGRLLAEVKIKQLSQNRSLVAPCLCRWGD